MWLIKGVCLFCASFGLVFCVTVYANAQALQEETLHEAQAMAEEAATEWWTASERFRSAAAEFFTAKLKEAEDARSAKEEAVRASVDADVDTLIEQPRPIAEQLRESSGIIEGIEEQAYRAAVFVFGNIFVFYGLVVLLTFLILRMIWRRARGY